MDSSSFTTQVVRVWKSVLSVKVDFDKCVRYSINNGQHVKFWKDIWCGDTSLKLWFPAVFLVNRVQDDFVSTYY